MAREFDAPRKLVFEAWTRPELLKRWLYGPEEWQLAECEIDLRVGGAYRFVWRNRDGKEKPMGLSGVYREIVKFERIVFTEVWDEDWTGGEAVVTIALEERGGKTMFTQTVLYASRAGRDARSPAGAGLAPSPPAQSRSRR